MPTRRRVLFCLAVTAFLSGAQNSAPAQSPPLVAAASDLQFALEEVSHAFTSATGRSVKISFGSSGNFARQIRQGAPIEMFLSADEQYITDLQRDGFTQGEPALYALGRIALFVPKGSPLHADGNLDDLANALGDERLQKFAIANPQHAPYGRSAREALQRKGLWEQIGKRLVLGENVSQAAQFASSSATQGGIIAYSLAISPRVSALGAYALVPEEWHAPLRQGMALTKNAGPLAREFFQFVQSPAAKVLLAKHGFAVPESK
ncbi:MAG: molybdate transport system substrate-binding protein [Variibacter sp.]|nr:molybdate transport system substrate-binding protein [Variibacter sp.]